MNVGKISCYTVRFPNSRMRATTETDEVRCLNQNAAMTEMRAEEMEMGLLPGGDWGFLKHKAKMIEGKPVQNE